MSNSLSYTSEDGQVVVSTQLHKLEEKEWVILGIHNTGPSIPPEEISRLFDRFFRGHISLEAGVPGAGLGLFIANEIVEQHGGRIEVEGELEQGATFGVWLPC